MNAGSMFLRLPGILHFPGILHLPAGNYAKIATALAGANFRMRRTIAMLLLAGAVSASHGGALKPSDDAAFLAAREAYAKGNIERLSRLAPDLREYPLYPYVAYWQLRSRLADTGAPVVEAFMSDYRDTVLAERLRADWLRTLARSQNWEAFEREYRGLAVEDTELTCYALQARLALQNDQSALGQARKLWFQGSAQPDSCSPLFAALLREGSLEEDDVWARIRLALQTGNVSFLRQLVSYLPPGKRLDPRQFESVLRKPQQYLDRRPLKLKTRAERELAMFAVARLGISLPAVAATRFEKIEAQFFGEEQAYVWAQLAVASAMKHRPEALEWFARAGDGLTDRQLNWKLRAALRQEDWPTVLAAYDAMSAAERQVSVWRYWRARALIETGRSAEGNSQLAALSFDHSFYGQLAMEELGTNLAAPPDGYRPNDDEVATMERLPGIQRAIKFYDLGLRYEGALEWRWTTRGFSDKELLAAAEVASRKDWYERAIDTAERTQTLHDFTLRYPTPYRDLVRSYAQQLDLDEAWIYGLVRQESRFSADARSSAGAAGLMQLMPMTARYVAKRLGIRGFDRSSVHTVDTNLNLGTFYLRQLLDGLANQPVLASAAYNAGQSRARDWRADRPLEGAVYIETIPFSETRDYVRKVMSNTMYYARQFGQPFIPLKQRLGQVAAKPLSNE
jgi:soluble lytic murein transglycosylase